MLDQNTSVIYRMCTEFRH